MSGYMESFCGECGEPINMVLRGMWFHESGVRDHFPYPTDSPSVEKIQEKTMSEKSPAEQVLDWLADERAYQVSKFVTEQDDQHTEAGFDWWEQQFDNYRHRAKVLGLDTPVGRQAAAKFAATAAGWVESIIRVYGPLPEAGVPSGNVGE